MGSVGNGGGHNNITMVELGWLCTALVSLMRNSTTTPQPPEQHGQQLEHHADQQQQFVHVSAADHQLQNAQQLLKLFNEHNCNNNNTMWGSTTATTVAEAAAATNSMMMMSTTSSSSSSNILLQQRQREHVGVLLEKVAAASAAARAKAADVTDQSDHQKFLMIADDHQRRLLDWLMTIVYTLISMFGIVGNIFVVIVVRTVPGMITPTNCYLMSLAVSDCIFLLSAAPVELSFLHVDWYAFGAIGCKVLSFLPFLGINSSSMSITAFTVERFIGICYPLRARYICTVKRAKLIILFIWCFCILYNSPWLYLATLIEHDDDVLQCSFRLERDDWAYKVMFVADFSAFYLIPMILYIYIYTRITYTLTRSEMKYSIANDLIHRNSQDVRSEFLANTAVHVSSTVSQLPDSPTSNGGSGNNKNVPKRSQGRDSVVIAGCGTNGGRNSTTTKGKVQVIKMLALVVFIFAVCWLPYRAMVMYNSFAKNFNVEMWNPEWFIYFSKTMIFFNWIIDVCAIFFSLFCAINPVLYNLMSARFRQAFLRLLSGKKQFINSYKRNSLYAQIAVNGAGGTTTTTGKTATAGGTAALPRFRTCGRTSCAGAFPSLPPAAHDDGTATGNNSSAVMLLSRMTAADAETRVTLMLRVQQRNVSNDTTMCRSSIAATSHNDDDDDDDEAESRR